MDRKLDRIFAQGLGHSLRPFGHQFSDALALSHLMDHFNHCLSIAPLQIHAVRIFLREDSLFIGFHGKANDAPCGNRVKSVTVAEFIRLCDGDEIVNEADPSEGPDRLIFRTLTIHGGIGTFRDLDMSPAGNGTVQAGLSSGKDRIVHRHPGDLLCPLPPSHLPVLKGKIPHLFIIVDPARCSRTSRNPPSPSGYEGRDS